MLKKEGKPYTDESAELASRLLLESGHKVVYMILVSDDALMIRESLTTLLENPDVEAVISCGGTGITCSDITIETVSPILEKELPGFGEIFRRISYDLIGSSAILTRCIAGTVKGKAVFCLPGSPQAVEIALRTLIIPEVGHILAHART
jgi:molybdenum cofactor biosynthesis protein B